MSLIIEIKVVPQSGRQRCILDAQDRLKCYLKNPPEKGKANDELIKLLAKALKIRNDEVTIISGQTSRLKRIKIESSVTMDDVYKALAIEKQLKLF